MANTCFTTYRIVQRDGKSDALECINSAMESLKSMEKSYVENGWGKTWLGNLVEYLGGDSDKVYCRGEWTDFYMDNTGKSLTICTETAWVEMHEFREFLKRLFDVDIYYMSDESGCDYFVTNDAEGRFFKDRFWLDIEDDPGEDYFETIEDVISAIEGEFGKRLKSREEVDAFLSDYSFKTRKYASLHEYRVDANDF